MARTSLSNSHSNLNLSHAKTVWMQKTIKVGNRMAEALRDQPAFPDGEPTLAVTWNELMNELVEMMLF